MAPRNYPLDAWAGNTFHYRFNMKQANGSPFDLTGSKLVFRAVSGSTTIRKATDEVDSGFEIIDAVAGTVDLVMTYEETRALPSGQLRYEIERWIDDEQYSLMFGAITVTNGVNDDADP